jgi:hypothetical protein
MEPMPDEALLLSNLEKNIKILVLHFSGNTVPLSFI